MIYFSITYVIIDVDNGHASASLEWLLNSPEDVATMMEAAASIRDDDGGKGLLNGIIQRLTGARLDATTAECCRDGHIRAIVLGDGPDDPLPSGCTAIQAGHREADTRVICELEALGVKCGDLFRIGRSRLLDPLGVALIGVERLFLRGGPRCLTMRAMVSTLTRKPCWACSCVHSSASVASGCSWTRRCAWASAASLQMARAARVGNG